MLTQWNKAIAVIVTAMVAAATPNVLAVTIFDNTSTVQFANPNVVVEPGTMGGTIVNLSLTPNPFMPSLPPAYLGNFATVDFTLAGGAPILASSAEATVGDVKVTAKRLPGSDPNDTLRIFIGQQQPDFTNEFGVITLIWNYVYDVPMSAFDESGFSTFSVPVSDWDQVTQLVFVDGGFADAQTFQPPNGTFIHNFDVLPITVTGFQTPTADGINDGDNVAPVLLEIESVVLEAVPEPSSALITIIGLGIVALRRVNN